MCGRYVIAYDPQTLVAGFSLTRIQPFDRRWNVTPQSAVPVVYETRAPEDGGTGERVVELMRWGLVPHWAPMLTSRAQCGTRPQRISSTTRSPLPLSSGARVS